MAKHFFFVPRLDYKSGWGTTTLNYLKLLRREDVVVFCNKKNNKIDYEQYPLLGKPLDYLKNPLIIIKDYLKIRKILYNNKNYKLFSHFPCELYSLILFFCGSIFKKNIYYAQGSYTLVLLTSLKTKLIFNHLKKYFSIIIYSSYFTKKIIEKKEKFKLTKIKRVINPIISLKDRTITQKIKKNKNSIICVGHLSPRKGQEELIYLIGNIKKKFNTKVNLYIVGSKGDNSYKKKLEKIIFSLNIKNQIKFFHKIDDNKLRELYLKSNLFILLAKKIINYFEGFGIVYLEAIKYGLPIIISKESGAIELQNYFKNFKAFNPKDFDGISKEVIRKLNNKNLNYKKNQLILLKFCNDNEKKLKKIYMLLNNL